MISIIIPCFNSGKFLLDAVSSIQNSSHKNFEILVVDDGSTDLETLNILDQVSVSNSILIFKKQNGGPASARNLGFANSKGDYLLFLDSDNRIRPDYTTEALSVLNIDPTIGVVYSKPYFFGEELGKIKPFEGKDFSLDELLAGNYIDMCSLVRKEAFLEVGGFDEHPDLIGFEDWDLWLRLSQTKWKFHFLDEVLFDYRIRGDSLMGTVSLEKRFRMFNYLGNKHGFLIHQRYRQYFRVMEKIQAKPFSFFLRILYYKYILRKSLLD